MHPMKRNASRFWILFGGAIALAGCSDERGYPSLAPRAVEQQATNEAEAPAPALPRDPALEAEVDVFVAQTAKGDADFASAAEKACTAVARGADAPAGSEAWLSAQQALSALESARAPVLAAAAALDRLTIERGTAEGSPVDLSRLVEAQAQVSGIEAAEQARVAELSAGRCPR
jgi:hypothetical protein